MGFKVKDSFIGSTVSISFPMVIPIDGSPQFMTIQAKLIDQDDGSITVEMNVNNQISETQIGKDKFLMISKLSGIKSAGMITPEMMAAMRRQQS